jgi:hypothetical protein
VLALTLERGRAAGGASAILTVWGGANVAVGALVLAHVITPWQPVDRHALRWHVLVWDMWLVLWGIALALAAGGTRRRRRPVNVRGSSSRA